MIHQVHLRKMAFFSTLTIGIVVWFDQLVALAGGVMVGLDC